MRSLYEAHRRALEPAHPSSFFAKLAELPVAHPQFRMSEREENVRMKLYYRELRDLPLDALEAGISHCLNTSVHYPKIAEIRQAAEPIMRERRMRTHRLGMMLAEPERPKDDGEYVSEEQLAELRRSLEASTRAKMAEERQREHEDRMASDPAYRERHTEPPTYRASPEAIERARRMGLVDGESAERTNQ